MIRTSSSVAQLFILGVLLAASGVTLAPGFLGGIFVTWVVVITAALLGCIIILEVVKPVVSSEYAIRQGLRAAMVAAPDRERPLTAEQLGRVFWFSSVFFVPIVVFGVYFGCPIGIAWILYRHCGTGKAVAIIFAVLAGTVLPGLFTAILSTTLWPGMLPEIIPRWLGGGVLPPI